MEYAEVKLTDGSIAKIDPEDFAYVSAYRWSPMRCRPPKQYTDYAQCKTSVKGKKLTLLMHRFVMRLDDPRKQIDHIDGNGLNNCKSNLRVCTQSENLRNTKLRSDNTSGSKGVTLESTGKAKKWRGKVCLDGKKIRRWFANKEDAIAWVNATRSQLHGEFARFQ